MFRTIPSPIPDEFAGRRALVTGGSRGIGAAIAQRLIDGGATVVASARSAADTTPAGATFIPGDISTLDGAHQLATATLEQLGGIDIIINNAAAARVQLGGVAATPDEEWQDSLNLNFLSAVRVTSALLPSLIEQGEGGAIVNISSNAALFAPPPLAHYGAAKAALNVYTKALATELAGDGIRANVVTPGNVLTPGGNAVRQVFADAGGVTLADTTAHVPLGRAGDPRDIAEVVAFLASDRAQWITGSDQLIDGGELPVVS
ncbi:MAG TPA: oxidoreductase [Baekduia sp.]|jgi:NAD(P)-dependent dehydrogenase (short-subunit alcohol dehydrogenase family)|nr:oxidoreductase [Baekduia sp.]